MLRTIVTTLDGSELSERALPFATALARAASGRLILLHLYEAGRSADVETVARLNAQADRLRAAGLEVEECVHPARAGRFGAEIGRFARAREADLVVMSTHGRTGLGRWMYGSVADQAVRHAETPVLLVPARSTRAWPEDRRLRVLVPLDGSAVAEQALDAAECLADTLGADLLLLHVVDPLLEVEAPDEDGYPFVLVEPGREEVRGIIPPAEPHAPMRRYLEGVAERLREGGRSVETLVRVGDPVAEITAAAAQLPIHAIVMTTRGRGGLARLVLGSIAAGVLRQAATPVLLTRPRLPRRLAPEPIDVRQTAGERSSRRASRPEPTAAS